jgi:hypothetical protein
MEFLYYYNITPEAGKVRNNLIYTSLISEDGKTFVKWFHNDSEYHMGMNQVVDPELMDIKWQREIKFSSIMAEKYPDLVPKILDVDHANKKIYLEIDGVDFWQRHYDDNCSYDQVLPDWRQQMIEIIEAHKSLDLWKYSMHPSSYFVVDGRLKSINYFFTYHSSEPMVTLAEHRSHISENRQKELVTKMESIGIDWDTPVPFVNLQILCFESFRSNYPDDFIEQAKNVFVN